jgi:TonB family protein
MLRQCLCCLACIFLLPGLASGDVLLVISSAAYNATANTITINGRNFGKIPIVTFDHSQVDARNVSDCNPSSPVTCIKAILPSPAPSPGSYQIRVTNKQAPLLFDLFKVTIGTIGPRGDTRAAGPGYDNVNRFVDCGSRTIRTKLAVRLPEYLTPERQLANLLADGSFEDGAKNWSPRSWRGSRDVSAVVAGVSKSGKVAAVLRSAVADDAMLWQKVAVKPKSWYLLSGWVKTEKVVIEEKGGTRGASLSIWGSYEASRSLVGTNDWTYVTLRFGSGERKEIEVGARLGHHGSTASGTAWFDDLVLVEIPGETKPSGVGPYVSGNGVIEPVAINQPKPPYTPEAREARIEGVVLLLVIIRSNGRVEGIAVIKGLGYGLDESAIKTIATKWRFKPALYLGKPVDFQAQIEVTFRLF